MRVEEGAKSTTPKPTAHAHVNRKHRPRKYETTTRGRAKALPRPRYLQVRVEHALDEGRLLEDLVRVPHELELLHHLKLGV